MPAPGTTRTGPSRGLSTGSVPAWGRRGVGGARRTNTHAIAPFGAGLSGRLLLLTAARWKRPKKWGAGIVQGQGFGGPVWRRRRPGGDAVAVGAGGRGVSGRCKRLAL